MAHRRSELALCTAALLLVATPVFAQAPAATTPPPASEQPPARKARRPATPAATPGPELENVRKAIEALTPEQRKQFRENFNRWVNLSSEEREALRQREEVRRKHMTEEIGEALKQLGIELDPPRRQAFMRRYTEERRKVEEQLRRETEAKRAPLVADIITRLKSEFAHATP